MSPAPLWKLNRPSLWRVSQRHHSILVHQHLTKSQRTPDPCQATLSKLMLFWAEQRPRSLNSGWRSFQSPGKQTVSTLNSSRNLPKKEDSGGFLKQKPTEIVSACRSCRKAGETNHCAVRVGNGAKPLIRIDCARRQKNEGHWPTRLPESAICTLGRTRELVTSRLPHRTNSCRL